MSAHAKKGRLWGAILLVAGTTIGAGMLALPVTTGLAGFFPSLLVMITIWVFMMATAFYLLEVNLRMKGESNLISMMKKTLGRPGEIVSWVTYLLLLYALIAAYIVGCGQLLANFSPFTLPEWQWALLIFLFFGTLVYLGTHAVDLLNRFLMGGLILTYLGGTLLGLFQVRPELLTYTNWHYLFPSLSVILTTFGYHIIIPTLTTYLDHDVSQLRRAIFIGSLLPLLVYLLWQFVVMGVIPIEGTYSLGEAARQGLQVTIFLSILLRSAWVRIFIGFFAFFAIVTSLLGVALSLSDFLSDGLRVKKSSWGKFVLVVATFFPPLLFVFFYPHAFLLALNYAGFLVLILLALLPCLMAWRARYGSSLTLSEQGGFRVPGGKPLLLATLLFGVLLFCCECFL